MHTAGYIIGRLYSPEWHYNGDIFTYQTHGIFFTCGEISIPFFSKHRACSVLRSFARRCDIASERIEYLCEAIPQFPLPTELSEWDVHMLELRNLQAAIARQFSRPIPYLVQVHDIDAMLVSE